MSADALVAEALAAAKQETPVLIGRGHGRTVLVDDEQTYLREDFADAALRHLAERVERLRAGLASFGVDPLGWEPSVLAATILSDDAGGGRSDVTCESWQERATRAEAALMRIVEIGDGVGFDVAVAALRTAGLLDAEETDDG